MFPSRCLYTHRHHVFIKRNQEKVVAQNFICTKFVIWCCQKAHLAIVYHASHVVKPWITVKFFYCDWCNWPISSVEKNKQRCCFHDTYRMEFVGHIQIQVNIWLGPTYYTTATFICMTSSHPWTGGEITHAFSLWILTTGLQILDVMDSFVTECFITSNDRLLGCPIIFMCTIHSATLLTHISTILDTTKLIPLIGKPNLAKIVNNTSSTNSLHFLHVLVTLMLG